MSTIKAGLNKSLHSAKTNKNDEFYTKLSDIENEVKHYKKHFKNKVVLCNCDDPRISNFFHFFSHNFDKYGLKKLIATCYKSLNVDLFSQYDSERAIYQEFNGFKEGESVPNPSEIGVSNFTGDGDFRSQESIELLKQADIVVTNPPFSLFREYVTQLTKYNKKFLIIGNVNAISYKECFDLIKENKMWLGYNCARMFEKPDGTTFETARTFWYTNLDIAKRHEDIILYKTYLGNENEYPKYDNYDAINVDKAKNIPKDYKGIMGVPITFMDKYNPEQFEIIGFTHRNDPYELKTKIYTKEDADNFNDLNGSPIIRDGNNYRFIYMRILIKNKRI